MATIYEVAINLHKDRVEVHAEGCRAAKTARRSGKKVFPATANKLHNVVEDFWGEVDETVFEDPAPYLHFHNCTK